EVFDHAARHASAEEAGRFTERAEFFFRYSVDTLMTMPTRTLARPVVLMLGHGMLRAHIRKHGVTSAAQPREDWTSRWPHPETFVPQKTRAMRRARVLAVTGAAVWVVAAALVAIRLL